MLLNNMWIDLNQHIVTFRVHFLAHKIKEYCDAIYRPSNLHKIMQPWSYHDIWVKAGGINLAHGCLI